MSDSQLFRKQTYPSQDSKVAVFFICPFGTKLWQVRPVLKRLQRAGYVVIAYDTTKDTFYAGEPAVLVQLVGEISDDVGSTMEQMRQQGIEEFGVFGSSLGAFLAYNCVSRFQDQLRWGVFNTGGDIAEAMWRLRKARRKHHKNGITQEQLAEAWQQIGYPEFSNLKGNSYVFFGSPSDKVAPLADMHRCIDPMQNAGAQSLVVSVRAVGHTSTVVRGLKRAVDLLEQARAVVE